MLPTAAPSPKPATVASAAYPSTVPSGALNCRLDTATLAANAFVGRMPADSSKVTAGGVTAAKRPSFLNIARRSGSAGKDSAGSLAGTL